VGKVFYGSAKSKVALGRAGPQRNSTNCIPAIRHAVHLIWIKCRFSIRRNTSQQSLMKSVISMLL
jgi:hypothetical protein